MARESLRIVNLTKPDIVKYGLYVITNQGTIINKLLGRPVSMHVDRDGYYQVSLSCEDGHSRNFVVSRLVAMHFCENDDPDHKTQVDHINGEKKFNFASNLEWVTSKENTRRAAEMGLRNIRGERNGHSIYSNEFVETVCQRYANGEQPIQVYRTYYGDDPIRTREQQQFYSFLYNLKKKKYWPDVTSKYDYDTNVIRDYSQRHYKPNVMTKYTEDDIHWICSRLEHVPINEVVHEILGGALPNFENYTADRIADIVGSIRRGRIWINISREYDFSNARKSVYSTEDYGRIFSELRKSGLSDKDIITRVVEQTGHGRRHIWKMYRQFLTYANVTDTPKEVILPT